MSIKLNSIDKLITLGLTKYEALAYLALLPENNATALEISERAGIPKQRVYDTLDSLKAKGLCLVQERRPRLYTAYPPEQALTALLDYNRQQQALEYGRMTRLIHKLMPSLNTLNNRNGDQVSLPATDYDHNRDYYDIGGF